jgi:NAD(P)-dependent dehydrogenase (short-subunit alcohol dehydrogenase family)
MMDVNFMGVVNCTLACREAMRARGGGVVINIASIAGYLSSTPYGVSKLAVRGLTIAFASELAPDRIRVNAIAPGLMGTEAALAELPAEFVTKFRDELQLVHRLGNMEDITATVLYLCSDAASFITGETLKVSGGYPLGI